MSEPHHNLRAALASRAPAAARDGILATADAFAPELARYAELIASPGGEAFGFMTRGEGPTFTARVAAMLGALDLPAAAIEHHAALARWFEHVRGFAKVEWHRHGDALTPMAAVYFRRRPSVEVALARLGERGVVAPVQQAVRELAAIFEKTSIHFVAAAFLPGREVQHKVYFSQLVLPERKAAIEQRLARAMAVLGLEEHRERHLALHRRSLEQATETTIYASFNFTAQALVPTMKLDYPGLSAAQVADWAREPSRPQVATEVEAEVAALAREMAGTRLAYLGVRLDAGRWPPRLKYYADQHGASQP